MADEVQQPQTEQPEQEAPAKEVELLDFWAEWCGPCKMMTPVLDELKEEFGEKVDIQEIDVDEAKNQELVGQYNIMSVPTYIFRKNGEVRAQLLGVQSKDAMVQQLQALLKDE